MTHANQREKTRKQQWVLTYCNYRSLLVSHSLLVSLVSLVSHAVTCLFHCQPLSDLFVSLSATSCFTCVTSCQPLSHLFVSLVSLLVRHSLLNHSLLVSKVVAVHVATAKQKHIIVICHAALHSLLVSKDVAVHVATAKQKHIIVVCHAALHEPLRIQPSTLGLSLRACIYKSTQHPTKHTQTRPQPAGMH